MNPRKLVFALVVVASVAAVAGYAAHVAGRAKAALAAAPPVATVPMAALPVLTSTPAPEAAAPAPPVPAAPAAPAPKTFTPPTPRVAAAHPQLLFRSTALGDSYGRVSAARLDAPTEPRAVSPLPCDRVHFAAGTGLCLEALRGAFVSYRAHVFDAKFALKHSMPLAGSPSRARVSPDGRLAAFTVFVSGHSYSSPGFVTQTSVIDTASGSLVVGSLETLPVLKDGTPFKAVDFNFWGVTFTRDGRRFYATLGTAGKVYLVEGDLAAGQMRVIHDDVECPSLSPDGARIAFKRRAPMDSAGRRIWRLVVLDLATRKETLLEPETRNVDDQVEWLNNQEILYALPKTDQQSTAGTDVWALRADAARPPRLLLPFAFSPAVMR